MVCAHSKTKIVLAGILPSLSLLSANESHEITFHPVPDYSTARTMAFPAM